MKCCKKAICVFFIALMLAMVFSACAQKSVEATKEETGTIEQNEANNNTPDPITLDLYVNYSWWLRTDWGNDMASKEITRITGVNLNIDKPANQEESVSRLNLMLSAGNYPDMVMLEDGQTPKRFIQKGMFIPLNNLIEQYGSDIKKNVGVDYLQEFCTESDGKIYGLPNGITLTGQFPDSGGGILILKGLYERLGSPPLETMDDLYKYLIKVRDCGMKTKNGESIIPSVFDWPSQNLAGSYGIRFLPIYGGNYVYGSDNKLQHVLRVPEMKEIFHFTSKLFREKLIDQDWLLQDEEKAFNKNISGRIAVYFSSNAYGWLDEYGDKLKKNSGDSFMLIRPPLMPGVKDPKYNRVRSKPWSRIYITSKCKDTVRATEFLNWQASEKGQYISRIGPEGVVWTAGPDGTPVITPEFAKKLKEDKEATLSEIGYMKWCWQQNNKFLKSAITILRSPEERSEWEERVKIIMDSTWYAPELEQLYIDPASQTGISNTKINTLFSKMDRKMYMAGDDATFESLYNTTLAEIEKLGLKDVEDELNRQISENLRQRN